VPPSSATEDAGSSIAAERSRNPSATAVRCPTRRDAAILAAVVSSAVPAAAAETARRRVAARLALPAFATGKALSLLVILLTVWSQSSTPGLPQRHEFGDAFSFWDGQAYLHIAAQGYPPGPLDLTAGAPGHYWAYLPGFPMLIHAVALLTRSTLLSAVLVCTVCELVALYYLALLVLDVRGGDERQAGVCVWLVALYPYGVFLTVAYTEAPFLAAALASLYLARRGREASACVAAALAIAVRITGLALLPALVWEHLRRRGWRPWIQLVGVALSTLPLLLFMLYARRQTGDALAYFRVQQSESFGNRTLVNPLTGLRNTWAAATAGAASANTFTFFMECVFGVAGFVALATMAWLLGVRRLAPRFGRADLAGEVAPYEVPMALILYGIVVWALPVSLTFWLSVPRYMLALVPAALLVAPVLAERPTLRWAVITFSGGLMALGCAIFASGRFLA
jgi:hypothetical protein